MAGKAMGYASIIQTYEKFIYTYVMLKVVITIDKEPLMRTKKMKPKSGANQKLTALVKMDGGNLQAVNCFRLITNMLGTDLNVPQNGVLKGAHIAWDGRDGFNEAAAALHGGPAQIVRLMSSPGQQGGDPSTGINPTSNQVTDNDGKGYIGVEGVGQPNKVPDSAKQDVKKTATVGVQVAVKGGDVFKDLIGAGVQSIGGVKSLITMPTEILYRMKWGTSGSLTFVVMDWSTGWKVDMTLTMNYDAVSRFAALSCASPYGPWEIMAKGKGAEATYQGAFHILFNEYGKAHATYEESGAAGKYTFFEESGTADTIITPYEDGYRIDFKNQVAIISGIGGTIPFGPLTKVYPQGRVFFILPAEGDDCN
jgi:hypothetical protein